MRNTDFLVRKTDFLIRKLVFLVRDERFLIRNLVLLVRNAAFLIRKLECLIRNSCLLVRKLVFLIRNAAFLVRKSALLVRNERFLVRKLDLLVRKSGAKTGKWAFLKEMGQASVIQVPASDLAGGGVPKSHTMKRRFPNAAGATGRVARPVKYGGDNGKPWRGALFYRARPVKYCKDNGKPWRRHYFTGRGARCLAMTEIKLGRTPSTLRSSPTAEDGHSLPRRSNSPRRNAVKTGAFRTGMALFLNPF